jgi:hypothetical protein
VTDQDAGSGARRFGDEMTKFAQFFRA